MAYKHDKSKPYLVADNGTIYHLVKMEEGQETVTGMPNVNLYATEEEMLAAIPKEYADKWVSEK